jgi:DNA (cytosine-5)-methyltransferase 1
MKYLSLFSGIGGFELGIQQAYDNLWDKTRGTQSGKKREYDEGSEFHTENDRQFPICIGYSEIDKYAIKIYEKHFPDHKNFGDITKITADTLPDFDFLCGGFPCQSFSIAGKRKGFTDTRGTLFFDIARILKAKRPTRFLLENVKGLLSHDNGQTFSTIISTLTELGYDLQWQVLNSKNFGVPQNRERVFIIGHLRGTPRPKIFPFTECNAKSLEELTNNAQQGYRVYGENGIAPTQASQAGGVGAKTGLVCPTIRATQHKSGDNQTLVAHTVRGGGRASGLNKKQNWDSYLVEGKIRRLTPVECARLQGFPDDWHKVEGISDTQAYKCYGNAVTVNVIKVIVEKLLCN